jgi:hypothetical protein
LKQFLVAIVLTVVVLAAVLIAVAFALVGGGVGELYVQGDSLVRAIVDWVTGIINHISR